MSGEEMLREAAELVASRRNVYGDPAKSMAVVAARWSLTLGRPITPAQVALCLIELARLAHDPTHLDSILDIAGYAALVREITR